MCVYVTCTLLLSYLLLPMCQPLLPPVWVHSPSCYAGLRVAQPASKLPPWHGGGADAAPAAMLTPLFAFQNVHRLMQLKSTQPSHPYPYSQALGRQASQAPDLFWFVSICEVLLAEHTVPCQWRFQPHCVGQSCGLLARSQQPALVQVCPKLCPPCWPMSHCSQMPSARSALSSASVGRTIPARQGLWAGNLFITCMDDSINVQASSSHRCGKGAPHPASWRMGSCVQLCVGPGELWQRGWELRCDIYLGSSGFALRSSDWMSWGQTPEGSEQGVE